MSTPRISAEHTPELDKMLSVKPKSQPIGEFLSWLQEEKHVTLAVRMDDDLERLVPLSFSVETLLAEYFEIDLSKVEAERCAILQFLREAK